VAEVSARARIGIAVVAWTACAACASTHIVRPLGKGNGVVHTSLGGPLVALGSAVFPSPIATVGGAWGVHDRVDVFMHANVTAMAFGDLHLEPGVAWHPLVRERGAVPTLTVGGSLHFLTDFRSTARVFPAVSGAAAWALGQRRHLVYGGLDLAVSFEGRAIFGPFVGGEMRVGRRVGLSLEVKWLAPYYDTRPPAPAWIAPGGLGYVSILLGVNVYLGSVH
jgi:hypothetical protein